MARDIVERLKETAIMLPRSGYVSVGREATEASEEITALRARLAEVEVDRDYAQEVADKDHARAKRAEAALATARRDALCECRDIGMEALTGDADGRDIYARIDALFDKDATP